MLYLYKGTRMLTKKGIKSGNGWLNEIVNVSMLDRSKAVKMPTFDPEFSMKPAPLFEHQECCFTDDKASISSSLDDTLTPSRYMSDDGVVRQDRY
jgi:hypothetical protein